MVMMAQPIGSAIEAVDPDHKARRIYLSPKGKTFRQEKVFELVEEEHLVLLCGHYEGVDQRAIDLFIDEEISSRRAFRKTSSNIPNIPAPSSTAGSPCPRCFEAATTPRSTNGGVRRRRQSPARCAPTF